MDLKDAISPYSVPVFASFPSS